MSLREKIVELLGDLVLGEDMSVHQCRRTADEILALPELDEVRHLEEMRARGRGDYQGITPTLQGPPPAS